MDSEFRQWLLEQLRVRRWSQSELARRMGVMPSAVNKWARGQVWPDAESVEKMARALGTDEDVIRRMVGLAPRERVPETLRAGEIIGMVKRIDWSDEVKFTTVTGILRMYLNNGSGKSGAGVTGGQALAAGVREGSDLR